MSRRLAQWKANHARRKGIANVQVVKDTDKSSWDVWVPLGSKPDSLPAMNKAAQLCRKMTSVIFADPPAPDVDSPSGDQDDEDANELVVRILEDVQGENQLNDALKARRAFDRANTFGSGFVRYYIHDKDSREPVEVEAGYDPLTGERAQTIEDAAERPVMQPVMDPLLGAPIVDPMTGQPAMQPAVDEMGMPLMEPWPAYEPRYVRPDHTLTDDVEEAAENDVPGIRSEVLTGRNVRFIPHTAEDIWDADGVVIGTFLAWGELKSLFPDLRELSEEARKPLFRFKPEKADDILPAGERIDANESNDNADEALVFTLFIYYEPCDLYPEGLYLVSLADQLVPWRNDWPRDIPLTQYAQYDEGRDDPYRVALMEIVGPGNEIRAAHIGAWLDHLERFNNPHVFVPTNSILTPKQWQQRRGVPIPINPGGQPEFEQVPDFPSDAKEMVGLAGEDMDTASGLGQLGGGVDKPSVESGRHALAIIAQGQAEVSEITDNVKRGYTRGCRIQLQLVRDFYSTPRKLRWSGEDGRHRERSWSGADLKESYDIRVRPGTMTMLTPTAKGQLIEYFAGLGIMDQFEMKEAVVSSLGGLAALQDDPFRLRIRRQISEWKEGPPEDADPMMAGQAIWAPVPADMLPDVAAQRLREIAKLMAGTAYQSAPPEWRQFVDYEFQSMQFAASPPAPVDPGVGASEQEQQAAQQQAADENEAQAAQATAMGALA